MIDLNVLHQGFGFCSFPLSPGLPFYQMWQWGVMVAVRKVLMGPPPPGIPLTSAWSLAGTHSTGKDQSYPGNQHGHQRLLQGAPCHSTLYETFLFSEARQRVGGTKAKRHRLSTFHGEQCKNMEGEADVIPPPLPPLSMHQ